MSQGERREEETLLAAVDALASGATEDVSREVLELFGLLPYELAPIDPGSEVKGRLLSRLEERRDVVDMTLLRTAQRNRGESGGPSGSESERAARTGGPPSLRIGTIALAAAAMICILAVGFLLGRVAEQGDTIARLRADFEASLGREAELRDRQAAMSDIKRNFEMITVVARHLYPLRQVPAKAGTPAVAAEGVVWVCGNHEQWYLNLHGLEPPPADAEYHLWFITPRGAVDGGSLEVTADGLAERGAARMPTGTQGFKVTLERAGREGREGETILLADRAVTL